MNSSFRSYLPLLCVLVLLTGCGLSGEGGCRMPARFEESVLGSQAPNFTLPDLDGNSTELSALVAEKPVLLIFWATWCPTCVEEIPVLNEWTAKYPGLKIIGINVQEPAERVKEFSRSQGILYPVLLDQEGEVAQRFGLVGIPASVLILPDGRIAYYGFSLPRNVDRFIQE